VAYTNQDARRQLLHALGSATDEIAVAVAELTAAYEQVDEAAGERLEDRLFRPLQAAYAQAQRAYGGYARAHALPTRAFVAREPPVQDAATAIEAATTAAERADSELAELQDSLLPVEVGDPALRAAITRVRQLLGDVGTGARELRRTLGR
jgi:hypothetical protein